MALPEPVWGWFALGKWHSYPCIALSWLKPYEEDSMQMWLYCFQASTGERSAELCEILLCESALCPMHCYALLIWVNIYVESMGQELSCRSDPTRCLLDTCALIPPSEVLFHCDCRPPWHTFLWAYVIRERKHLAGSSPKTENCVITLNVSCEGCMYYTQVVLNMALQKESSGKFKDRPLKIFIWYISEHLK